MKKYLALILGFFLLPLATLADSTITISTGTTGSTAFGYDTTQVYSGQSFLTTQAGTISSITTRLFISGAPADNLEISLQADVSGHPSGTAIATTSPLALSSWGSGSCTAAAAQTLTFPTPVSVNNATTYWIVMGRTGALSTVNRPNSCGDLSNTYANGTESISNNANSWTNEVSDLNIQLTIVSAAASGNVLSDFIMFE